MKKLILILSIFIGISLIADNDPSWAVAMDAKSKCTGTNCQQAELS